MRRPNSLSGSSPGEFDLVAPSIFGARRSTQDEIVLTDPDFVGGEGQHVQSPPIDCREIDQVDALGDFTANLAVVVFSSRASLGWLRLLKPGFRHCFVLLRTADQWLYYDPMAHYTFASAVGVYPVLSLLRFFRRSGYRTLIVRPCLPPLPPPRPLAWRPYTCVEAVKRVLGLQAPWILTPWQLYQLLVRMRRHDRDSRRALVIYD